MLYSEQDIRTRFITPAIVEKAGWDRDRLIKQFESTPILRSREIVEHDIDSKTVQRMVKSGEVQRIARGTRLPKTTNHAIKVVTFTGEAFSEGIEEHEIEGFTIRVYSVAKTVADCFKYRNKIGTDVALEALWEALQTRKATADEILH